MGNRQHRLGGSAAPDAKYSLEQVADHTRLPISDIISQAVSLIEVGHLRNKTLHLFRNATEQEQREERVREYIFEPPLLTPAGKFRVLDDKDALRLFSLFTSAALFISAESLPLFCSKIASEFPSSLKNPLPIPSDVPLNTGQVERKHLECSDTARLTHEFQASPDYRSVNWLGRLHELTFEQAEVIRYLHDRTSAETPFVSAETLLSEIGKGDARRSTLRDIFRGAEATRKSLVVAGRRKGTYGLACYTADSSTTPA